MGRSRLADVKVHLHYFTAKAFKVSLDGDEENAVWVPSSIAELDREPAVGESFEMTLPEGIALEKGLI